VATARAGHRRPFEATDLPGSGSFLACRTAVFRPFEDAALRWIARLGIRHVEMHVPARERIADLRRELDFLGLRVSVLQGACDVARADVAEQVQSQMPTFAALGCTRMLIRGNTDEVPLALACERLRAAAEAAATQGVTILIETHPGFAPNAATALRTIQTVDHPTVRLNFDPANIHYYNRDLDPVEELRQVAPFVAAVHLKDTTGGFQKRDFPELGSGIVNFAALLKLLDDHQFAGPLTLEIEGREDEERTEALIVSRLERSLEHLRALRGERFGRFA
jgi:sugar phosphate isomerase/epimerase